jgi:hypothetical protein
MEMSVPNFLDTIPPDLNLQSTRNLLIFLLAIY